MMRVAAFDFGTVTTRMLIADVNANGIDELTRRTEITHLGEGLNDSGLISAAACERILATCRDYLATAAMSAEDCQVTLAAVGTSALRDAQNRDDLLIPLARLGIRPQVITGSEEARLSFWGALSGFLDSTSAAQICGLTLVADIGGGSTELIAGYPEQDANKTWAQNLTSSLLVQRQSFDVGARRLTDRFLLSDPPTTSELDAAWTWTMQLLTPWFEELTSHAECPDGIARILAVAGTATTAVAIRDMMAVYDPIRVHGSSISAAELHAVREQLCALPLTQRLHVTGLEPGRASVVIGGLLVLEVVLKLAGLDSYIASESDILRGIVLDTWLND